MTKKDLLNVIKDLPDDVEIYIAHDNGYNPDIEYVKEVDAVRIEYFVSDWCTARIIIRGEISEANNG